MFGFEYDSNDSDILTEMERTQIKCATSWDEMAHLYFRQD